MVIIKNEDEIKSMREAGAIANTVLREVALLLSQERRLRNLTSLPENG